MISEMNVYVSIEKLYIFKTIVRKFTSGTCARCMHSFAFSIDKTTILVSQVYSVCATDPSSLKRAQLVPQVFKMSNISHFTNCH